MRLRRIRLPGAIAAAIVLTMSCGGGAENPPADSTSTSAEAPAARSAAGGALNPSAQIGSKTVRWENDTWIPVGLSSEGIEIKEVRFAVEGGIHWNPLRAGVGPQAFVTFENTASHPMRLAIAVALFDAAGGLIAATEAKHIGQLDPAEKAEMKLTFREVKRRFLEAKTAQIALETYK